MKKNLLTISAALIAGAAMATSPRVGGGSEGLLRERSQSADMETFSSLDLSKKVEMAPLRSALAPARVYAEEPIIHEAPAGEKLYYNRNTIGFYIYQVQYVAFGMTDVAADIVFGDDGYAYIHNPFRAWRTDSYLKCEIKDNKLVATLPQAIYEEDYENESGELVHADYYATLLYHVGDEDTPDYVVSDTDEVQTISWTMEDDRIVMDIEYDTTKDKDGYYQYPKVMLGMVDAEGNWMRAGDCLQIYTEVEVNPVVAPEGLVTSEWALIAGGEGQVVNVGFDGDDVYINNLNYSFPEAFAKGKIEGDKIVFESGQYLGIGAFHFIYFIGATYDDMYYYLTDSFTFNYDAENKIMTSEENTAILLNASFSSPYFISAFEEPLVKVHNKNPKPVPGAPIPYRYSDYYDSEGFTYLTFLLPNLNVDNDILSTNNMYYELYIDDDLFTFDTKVYNVDEDMSRIPYDFSDGKGIYANGISHSISLYFTGFDTVGLRLYNVVDDTTYASPLTVWDVINDTYYIDNSGVEEVLANKAIAGVEYYNLQGMKLDRPGRGINVCRTIMEDGSMVVKKILVK